MYRSLQVGKGMVERVQQMGEMVENVQKMVDGMDHEMMVHEMMVIEPGEKTSLHVYLETNVICFRLDLVIATCIISSLVDSLCIWHRI